MAKKKKKKNKGQFPPSESASQSTSGSKSSQQSAATKLVAPGTSDRQPQAPKANPNRAVQPEHTSLTAHSHIAAYIDKFERAERLLTDSEINAVLQLAQHLRVFGLVSAAGFVGQTNDQGGSTQEKRRPVWELLLCQLIDDPEVIDAKTLKREVLKIASDQPAMYMALWRRAVLFSKHWNFWAKAYQTPKTEKSSQDSA